MTPQIELISGVRSRRVDLLAERTTIGKAAENDIAVDDDATASGLHAVLERFAAGWCVTDLGSSNGTWVNGERIWSSRRLRHGDEIRVGQRPGWSSTTRWPRRAPSRRSTSRRRR